MSEVRRDDDGNLIDPPVIREHEDKLIAAANSGDNEAVAKAQADYDKARHELVSQQESEDSNV